jgi:LPS export ABC transporter protein LptC
MATPVYIRPLLAFLVTAAIISMVAVILRSGSHDSAPVLSVSQQLPHNIDVALKKARFSEIKDGLVVWELVAERVSYDKVRDTAYLFDIRMEFPQTGSSGSVTVTADNGVYVTAEKNVRLSGRVLVVTADGARFNTDSIVYTGARDQFSTADSVTFRHHRLQMTAVGMEMGVKSQRARFFSAVDALLVPN